MVRIVPFLPRPRVLLALVGLLSACGAPSEPEGPGFVAMSDGTQVAYERIGQGSEVLVVPMRAFLAAPLASLADGRQVILYDPRGRGASDPADTLAVSLDRNIADLEELRAALGIERMALLGWSGLGMEMAVYTIRHPERVTRLVQVAPVPPARSIMRAAGGDTREVRTDTAAIRLLLQEFDAGAHAENPAGFCREYQRLTLPGNFVDASYAAQVPDVCQYANEWPVNLWPYFGALLPSFGDYDWREALHGLTVPRLVIHGREDGIPIAGARAWVAGYPTARLIELSPAGHFPFLEQQDVFLRAVRTFLDGGWPPEATQLDPGS